jgi:hypothetical protein
MGGTKWKVEAERRKRERERDVILFSFPGVFKTYANPWEEKNLLMPNQ